MKINQSTIKRLASLSVCPRRFYLERITKEVAGHYSDAMRNGNYFEWLLFGTKTRDGDIPVMPRLKNGEKSTDQVRIQYQVDVAKAMFRNLNIKIEATDYAVSEKFNDEIIFEGLLDVLAEWHMPPMWEKAPFIFDIKLTTDVNSTFGEFSWGGFNEVIDAEKRIYIARQRDGGMDLLQAYSYMYLMERKTRVRFSFAYLVFDHKKVPEYKIILVPHDQVQIDRVICRLTASATKLKSFASLGYPEIPTVKECRICRALDCSSRIDMMTIGINNPMPGVTHTPMI